MEHWQRGLAIIGCDFKSSCEDVSLAKMGDRGDELLRRLAFADADSNIRRGMTRKLPEACIFLTTGMKNALRVAGNK